MLYLALATHFISLFFNPNYNLLESGSKWEDQILGIEYGYQYRNDAKSSGIIDAEYIFKNTNPVFRFKSSILSTTEGSTMFSFGISKDIYFNNKIFLTSHFMPTIASTMGNDRKNAASGLKFNIGIGFGYMLSKNTALTLEWKHISSNYTTMPNEGIETIGLNLKIAF
jgi:hypothetical protein